MRLSSCKPNILAEILSPVARTSECRQKFEEYRTSPCSRSLRPCAYVCRAATFSASLCSAVPCLVCRPCMAQAWGRECHTAMERCVTVGCSVTGAGLSKGYVRRMGCREPSANIAENLLRDYEDRWWKACREVRLRAWTAAQVAKSFASSLLSHAPVALLQHIVACTPAPRPRTGRGVGACCCCILLTFMVGLLSHAGI